MARRTQSSRILRSRQVAACDGRGAATMQGVTADSGYGLLRMDSSVAVPCAPHTHTDLTVTPEQGRMMRGDV